VTPTEAARRLNLSIASVRRELASGRLGCARIGPGGRRLFISEADLAAYLEACRVRPETVRASVPSPPPSPPMPECLARFLARHESR
jgi:excisionase family DNA binding protein